MSPTPVKSFSRPPKNCVFGVLGRYIVSAPQLKVAEVVPPLKLQGLYINPKHCKKIYTGL